MGKTRPSRGLASSKKPTGSHRRKKPTLPHNPVLRPHWNPRRTVTENYTALGIPTTADSPVATAPCTGLKSLLGTGDFAQSQMKLKEWEYKIIARLANKHGTNYAAMSRDIKTNEYQWTAKQIQRMHETMTLSS